MIVPVWCAGGGRGGRWGGVSDRLYVRDLKHGAIALRKFFNNFKQVIIAKPKGIVIILYNKHLHILHDSEFHKEKSKIIWEMK